MPIHHDLDEMKIIKDENLSMFTQDEIEKCD